MMILASQSPRRQQLLSWTGWDFQVIPAFNDEEVAQGEPPLDYVKRMSCEKAVAIHPNSHKNDLILAADTIVLFEEKILGKPANPEMAKEFLAELRGKVHQVHTALCIQEPGMERIEKELCTSQVEMRGYSEEEMQAYIDSGDPMDKAGAYAVQHKGFHPVKNFKGCLANVMGLPLCHLVRAMGRMGVDPRMDVPFTCQKNLGYDCPVTARILKGENVG